LAHAILGAVFAAAGSTTLTGSALPAHRIAASLTGRRPAADTPQDVWQGNLARVVEHLGCGQR
jgi:hypothetical protein